jgi:hypothetical protein
MRPVPLFGVVASITFLLTCAYFLWKPINDEIPVQSVDQEAVIMGYMGNKTQK